MPTLAASAWLMAIAVLGLGVVPAGAQDIDGHWRWLSQVRDGDQARGTEFPNALYGDTRVSGLPHRSRVEASFQLGYDPGVDDGVSDLYLGSLHTPAMIPGVAVTLGRQWMNDGPGGAYVVDGGRVAFDRGGPVAINAYAGAPRYFEPLRGTEIQSDDEFLFGASLRTTRSRRTKFGFGFQQLTRDGVALRQLVTATLGHTLAVASGRPRIYASAAFDTDRQNLDTATLGATLALRQRRLRLHLDGSYYRPQDDEDGIEADIDRREDSIFETFAFGEMAQLRTGMTYLWSPGLSGYARYSIQDYEVQADRAERGHVAAAGIRWLPEGDGLEVVRLEYYVTDSQGGGHVDGGRASYESHVYERISYRGQIDVSGIDKASNQGHVAVSSLLGLTYAGSAGLSWDIYVELNRNDRFDEDLRLGFSLRYALGRSAADERTSSSSDGERRDEYGGHVPQGSLL